MNSYQDIFLYITKDGEKHGPYCIPCSTKNEFNRLIKIERGQWKGQWRCEGCNRVYKEGDIL